MELNAPLPNFQIGGNMVWLIINLYYAWKFYVNSKEGKAWKARFPTDPLVYRGWVYLNLVMFWATVAFFAFWIAAMYL